MGEHIQILDYQSQLLLQFRHNDLAWNIRQFVHNKLKTVNFSADLSEVIPPSFPFSSALVQVSPWSSSKWSHTDIPRLQKGKVGAQVKEILYYYYCAMYGWLASWPWPQ